MNNKNDFALVRKPSSAVEKAAPRKKRIFSGMVAETLVVANAQMEKWFEKGEKHYYGRGARKNYSEAVKWFRKAGELGHAKAQLYLGFCYSSGEGVPKNDAEAMKWYRQAAEQGNAVAQDHLGACYRNGILGVPRNYAEAAKWYRKAAEGGNAIAQGHLAVCYADGMGVPQSYAEAAKWCRKASESYRTGTRTAVSNPYIIEAYKWYSLAAKQGDDTAAKDRESIAQRMSPDELKEGERLYRIFLQCLTE